MIVAIHQLHYLPWLRYFHKMASADVFVVLDNIQFTKNEWQNRNKIKTQNGMTILTVPVLHRFAQNLNEVRIDRRQPWARKHWGTLAAAYRKTPFFETYAPFLGKIYAREWEFLNDLNYEMFFYFVKALGLKTRILRSSSLSISGEATERLVQICKQLQASVYLTGAYAAQTYLDESLFKQEGIQIVPHEFECPLYPQIFPDQGFIPELSMVDLLFNCGPKSLEILMNVPKMREIL